MYRVIGGETAKWPNVAEGEEVAAFLCLFGIREPPQHKKYFLPRLRFVDEALGEYIGREVWHKLHLGGGIHQAGGYDPPPKVCVMQLLCGPSRLRPRGEGPESGRMKWWWWRRTMVALPHP